MSKKGANTDEAKLAKEKMAMEKKIQKELAKLWEDPSVESYFKNRVKKEEAQRHLEQLKHQNEALETEYVHLVDAMVEKFPTSEMFPGEFEVLSRTSSRFRETQKKSSSIGEFSQLMDSQWRNHCEKAIASLSKTQKGMSNDVSEKIQQEIKGLQRQLDQNLNHQLEKFIERKLKKEIEHNSKRLKKLIDEPIEELTQQVVERARKVDATEDMVVTSMYKIANFLNKGEFDVSFWQKMKIFSTNFKQYIADYSKFTDHPKNLEKLCLDIKSALEKGKPDKVSDLIENYFDLEQKKMEAAFVEVEEAIDKAMKKDGEQFVDELLQNTEKELSKKNPLYKKVKQVETIARRADTVMSYFQTNKGEKESPTHAPSSPTQADKSKNESKRKRNRDL